jgi:hypothetical protein
MVDWTGLLLPEDSLDVGDDWPGLSVIFREQFEGAI